MNSKLTKFLIFVFLFAGIVEAKGGNDNSNDDSFTFSASYNPFAVSSCSTLDRYSQASVKVNYDKRFHKNWEFHSSAVYSKSVQLSREYHSAETEEEPHETFKNSGYINTGFSFWWDYVHLRADLSLFLWDEYKNGNRDKIRALPMLRGLVEAGKMDKLWVSLGSLHPEFPDGLLQVALSGNIFDKSTLGGGFVWAPMNISVFRVAGAPYSLFLFSKIKISEKAFLKSYINVKPHFYNDPSLMLDFSLGFEYRF
ncbi:MAG: hypothetical protein ACOX2F_11225 [bacterium]